MTGNLPPSFKTIDRVAGTGPVAEEVASIKTIDVKAKSYQKPNALYNTMRRYTRSVSGFKTEARAGVRVTAGQSTRRVLDVVVEPGAPTPAQEAQIQRAVQAGKADNVTVNVHRMK